MLSQTAWWAALWPNMRIIDLPENEGARKTMPKLKTHKATAKRFKITGSGKLRRRKQSYGHKRSKKSKRARYQFRNDASVSKADRKRVRRLLGK